VTEPGSGEAAEPIAGREGVRLALILGQLVLLLLVIRAFELENRTVFYLLVAAVLGFAVHALLPLRYRLPFFGALSVASVLAVLGWRDGAIVLGVGYALIGACDLPVPFWLRVVVIGAIAGGLVVLRVTTPIFAGPSAIVVATLGSMFMFRLALYLHAFRHGEAPHGLTWSTAYFFMVPNVCYPLFPVVDYSTFVRTHFDAERFRTYDRGVRFLLRGVLQLLCYRLVYYELAIDSLYVNNLADLVRFVVSNFLLYVKISGQFWLIIGVLGLFGFRLPETNHLYFLASSPTDFWRRINIYWKDFMMKLVYYPSFFRLRRYGTVVAVGLATLAVFLVTWLLHAYQYYWLQNEFSLSRRDMLFWGVFGLIVIGFALWEARPGRLPVRKTERHWSLGRGLTTVATFSLIAVLWSLWNARSLPTWLFMWTQARYSTPAQWAGLVALLLLAAGLAGFAWGAPTLTRPPRDAEPLAVATRRATGRILLLTLLATVTTPMVRGRLTGHWESVVRYLRAEVPAMALAVLEPMGYYQVLTGTTNRAAIPWEVPHDWGHEVNFFPHTRDILEWSAPPSTTAMFAGAPFTTNRWGMRDREDYTLAKPDSVYRIAVFGPSDVVGWGVADSDVFTVRLTALLDSVARLRRKRVEVMNFGMPGTNLVQQVERLRQFGLRFSPDLVLLTVHDQDLQLLTLVFRKVFANGAGVPDSALARILAGVGLGPGLDGNLANLRIVEEELDARAFRWAQELASGVGARVALVALRGPLDQSHFGNLRTTRRAASREHVTWLDCTEIWKGRRLETLWVASWDQHPNALGHRLIAACVLDQLERNAAALDVGPLLNGPGARADR